MSAHQPVANRYKEIAITTANPLQLVVMLYDGAIHSLQEAQEHLRRKDISSRSRCVNRAIAIVSELQSCLNFQDGGNIAVSLDRLYSYMKQRIFMGNLQQKPEPLAEVVVLLESLRSAWGEVASPPPNELSPPGPAFEKAAALGATSVGRCELSSLNISG